MLTNVFVFIIAAADTPKGQEQCLGAWSTTEPVLGVCVFNHITVLLQNVQRTFSHKEIYVGQSGCTPRHRPGRLTVHRLDSCVYTFKTQRETISFRTE